MAEEIVWSAGMDDKDFNRGITKMVKEIETLKQKLRDVQGQTEKNAKAGNSWLKGQAGEVKDMALQWVSVGAVVGIATSAYQRLRAETERLGEAHQKLSKDITTAIAKAGDLANASTIQTAIGSVKGATREQAAAAFSGISSAAPGMDLQRRLALMREVAPMAPTGANVTQLGNIAGKIGQLMPGTAADDVLDVTAMMRQRTGEDFERVGGDEFEASMARLQQAGMSPIQSMAIGLAGVEANLPSKAINKIAGSLFESDPTAGHQGRMTTSQRLQRQFYKLDAQSRFQALSSDKATAEAVLGTGGALNMSLIGDTKQQQAELVRAQRENFAQQQVGQLGGFQAGREQLREQQTAVVADQATRARAAEEAQFQRAASFARSQTANASDFAKARTELTIGAAGFFGVPRGPMEFVRGRTDATRGEQLVQELGNMGMVNKQKSQEFLQQEKASTAMIMELKGIRQALTDGKKKNVDQHNE
jgi:hypothetical protein